MTERNLKKMGYDARINQPYEGTLEPQEFYRKDQRVASIMIEVNRSLYMDEMTGTKKDSFESFKEQIQNLQCSFKKFHQAAAPDRLRLRSCPATRTIKLSDRR